MSNSHGQMKSVRKNPLRYSMRVHRSVPDLLASGVATFTFDAGGYWVHIEDVNEALERDRDAIVRDAWTAYSRIQDEREPA